MTTNDLTGDKPTDSEAQYTIGGGQTTAITLFEREDGKRAIRMGARDDETVVENGQRYHDRAVKTIRLPGDLTLEDVREAYAGAESIPGKASSWLGGGAA